MQLPEIGKVTASSFAPLCYVFFVRLFLQSRSPALLLPLTGRSSIIHPFRFRVQRYYNYLIYASVLVKKLQKYVVKHKKEGAKPPPS